MAVIKQKTIPSGTLKLLKLKNDSPELSNKKYKYVVEFPDGDRTFARFSKMAGENEFNRIAENRSEESMSGGGDGFLSGVL